MEFGVLLLIVFIIIILVVVAGVKIVSQSKAYVVERLGAYHRTMQTGLHYVVPILDRVACVVSLKEMVKDFAPQVIITNPPFNQAVPIIEKALDDVADDGYVIMLLRLNFFGSKDRKPFFDKYMPEWCFVHHIRIGFCDKKNSDGYVEFDKNGQVKRGSTDSMEDADYVLKKGLKSDYAKMVVN